MAERLFEINGMSAYPDAVFKYGRKKEIGMDIAENKRVALQEESDRVRALLERVEVRNRVYEELVMDAQADLYWRYSKAGVENIAFPSIYFVPEKFRVDVNPLSGDWAGVYDGGPDVCIIYLTGDDYLAVVASAIHHELHHSLGTRTIVLKEVGVVTEIVRGQLGHTVGGNLLEEGVMDYFAKQFVMESNHPDLVRANDEGLPPMSCDGYAAACDVVGQLVARAAQKGGLDGAEEMEKLLLLARVDAGAKSRLVRLVTSLYGDYLIARCLFSSNAELNEANGLKEMMERVAQVVDGTFVL